MLTSVNNAAKLQQLFGQAHLQPFNPYSKSVFSRLHQCHTATLGMHTYKCSDKHCGKLHYQYHPARAGWQQALSQLRWPKERTVSRRPDG